jgi:hypothetical protein
MLMFNVTPSLVFEEEPFLQANDQDARATSWYEFLLHPTKLDEHVLLSNWLPFSCNN